MTVDPEKPGKLKNKTICSSDKCSADASCREIDDFDYKCEVGGNKN